MVVVPDTFQFARPEGVVRRHAGRASCGHVDVLRHISGASWGPFISSVTRDAAFFRLGFTPLPFVTLTFPRVYERRRAESAHRYKDRSQRCIAGEAT